MTSLVDTLSLKNNSSKNHSQHCYLTRKITCIYRKRLSSNPHTNVIVLLLSLPVGISPEPAAHLNRNSSMGQRTGSNLFKDTLETIQYPK